MTTNDLDERHIWEACFGVYMALIRAFLFEIFLAQGEAYISMFGVVAALWVAIKMQFNHSSSTCDTKYVPVI